MQKHKIGNVIVTIAPNWTKLEVVGLSEDMARGYMIECCKNNGLQMISIPTGYVTTSNHSDIDCYVRKFGDTYTFVMVDCS